MYKVIVTTLVLSLYLQSKCEAAAINADQDGCEKQESCSSCLTQKACSWCVTKSKCTKQTCGTDSIIYPKHAIALMAGDEFCPRTVNPEKDIVVKSGKIVNLLVKVTQIYVYMAFTPWKCKFNVNGKETLVAASLLGDVVYCMPVVLYNETGGTADGSITILWESNKPFDGPVPIKVIS